MKEGYLSRLKTPKNVYVGEAVVKKHDGSCYVLATDTGGAKAKIYLEPQYLQPSDILVTSDEDLIYSEGTGAVYGRKRNQQICDTLKPATSHRRTTSYSKHYSRQISSARR